MSIDLRKRMTEFKALESSLERGAPPGWEEKYIIHPGEIPWWDILEPKERARANGRQNMRMQRVRHPGLGIQAHRRFNATHPGYNAEGHRRFNLAHLGYNAEALRLYEKEHPGYFAEHNKRYNNTLKGRINLIKHKAKRRKLSTNPAAYADRVLQLHTLEEPCAACKKVYEVSHTVDHIVALCLGGTDDWSNLQPLCIKCHRKKTRQDMDTLRKRLGGW